MPQVPLLQLLAARVSRLLRVASAALTLAMQTVPISSPSLLADELLTTPEVASLLRVTPRYILTLTHRRVLRPVRLGRRVRFLRSSVLNAMKDLENVSWN